VHRLLPDLVERLTSFGASAIGTPSILVAVQVPGAAARCIWSFGPTPPTPLIERVANLRGPVSVEDIEAGACDWVAAFAAAPVTIDGERVGGVCVADVRSRPWSQNDRTLLKELANLIGYCHGQRHIVDQLLELSHVDELTNLYNRRGFMNLGEQHLKLACRERRPVTLFFVDLNGMKQVNDELGHHAGDQALRDAAAILRATFRDSDVVARLGGDEFAILAHDCSEAGTEAVRDRLDAAIAAFNDTGSRPFKVSMSVGAVTRMPDDTQSLAELVTEADERMYREKRRWRRAAASHLASSYTWATSPLDAAPAEGPEKQSA